VKRAGIVGGIGPESTVEYYRFLIEGYREKTGDGSYPSLIINSIDMKRMLDGIGAGRIRETVDFLAQEVDRVAVAGADFAVLASNTPHIVFDELRKQARIPMISIVEATCRAAIAIGVQKVGLFGTRFTMQGRFYNKVLETAGIECCLPSLAEQETIHEKYMSELVQGIVSDDTRRYLVRVALDMKVEQGIRALILGGTELPLVLRDAREIGIPLLDTTKIHVKEIVELMIEGQ
jgi:aspartate racemase